jgi:hypothetical protein
MDDEWQGLLLGKDYEKDEDDSDEELTLKNFEATMKEELQASWDELKKVIKEEIRREIRDGFKELTKQLCVKLNLPLDPEIQEPTNNTIIRRR